MQVVIYRFSQVEISGGTLGVGTGRAEDGCAPASGCSCGGLESSTPSCAEAATFSALRRTGAAAAVLGVLVKLRAAFHVLQASKGRASGIIQRRREKQRRARFARVQAAAAR
ncbi:hypothetical protein PR202_ga22346 [Eleusine coracana subsp. coracana]|uniref:Uncharacterized protein n=1 Tax=Eleusine coracana subsp. coracana TaxID=191504 RepID=A0AAV5D3C7_ELECO|nr:hypothetical protein PR202_ga22346 [Eleusine coracana subsp. coracana]